MYNLYIMYMLKRVVTEDGRNWDRMISYVFFGIWDVPQVPPALPRSSYCLDDYPMGW